MKVIVIDNYDSFVYNLVHLLRRLDAEVRVVRNDRFLLEELEAYDKILLSPEGEILMHNWLSHSPC